MDLLFIYFASHTSLDGGLFKVSTMDNISTKTKIIELANIVHLDECLICEISILYTVNSRYLDFGCLE